MAEERTSNGESAGATVPLASASSAARAGSPPTWIENRARRGWIPRFDLAELWASREITLVLALRNVKTRYKQTVIGVAWTLVQPLAAVAIFSLLFGRLAHVPSEDLPYPVFVYPGLALWFYFSTAATLASESLVQYRDLVTKVYFPRLHAPLSSVLPGLIDLGISLIAVAVFMVIYGVAPTAALLLLPLWILGLVVFTFAVGTWLCALNIQYRDVRNVLAFVLQLWFFVTPIVYATSLLEGRWTFLLALNPVAGLVTGLRWSLVGAPAPGLWAIGSAAVGLFVLLTGAVYFGRVQRRFADLI
jgi:homopolymeric O-antigen transport system permease protein